MQCSVKLQRKALYWFLETRRRHSDTNVLSSDTRGCLSDAFKAQDKPRDKPPFCRHNRPITWLTITSGSFKIKHRYEAERVTATQQQQNTCCEQNILTMSKNKTLLIRTQNSPSRCSLTETTAQCLHELYICCQHGSLLIEFCRSV